MQGDTLNKKLFRYKRVKAEFEQMVANDESVSEEEEEEDSDELSGVEEIDFTPDPKRRKIDKASGKVEMPKTEGKKDETKKETLLPPAEKKDETKKEALPATDKTQQETGQGKRLNKKAKKKLAEQETAEEKEEKRMAEIAKAGAKKTKTAAQKRLVNSKKRRASKVKTENEAKSAPKSEA